MKNLFGLVGVVFALITSVCAQTFVGTNAPGTGTNFSISVAAGATNLSIIVSNTVSAYSHLFVKRDGVAATNNFDFSARVNGATNQVNLELPELTAPANYNVLVFTPAASVQHAFTLSATNDRAGLRTTWPVIKPVALSVNGSVTNGQWNYFQVDVPTNLPGWRLVLSHNGVGNPNLYVRRAQLPSTSVSDKSSTGVDNDTLIFANTEATNGTYFVGVNMPGGALNAASYTLSAETNVLTPLVWDSGATHEGTQVFTNTSVTGGDYYFRITAQNSSVGAMRVALNVSSGEADIFMRKDSFAVGQSQYTAKSSTRVGSDGFVLAQGSDYSAGQELYFLVRATPGAQWTLVAGQAHVINFGNLAAAGSSATSTNVTIGAEGWRFFRTTIPVGTLAWRLGLNGATNELFVRKTAVPFATSSSTYDQKQPGQMLLVPSYLVGGDSYYIGVPGTPGAACELDNRQQTITDLAFNGAATVPINSFGYTTFRVQVPVQQIAWLTAFTTTLGDGNFAIRRNAVANEWNNDAFSEVSGLTTESTLLVPPTLSDGTFYITVYGRGAYSGTLTSGNPPITDISFAGMTTNDQPSLVGWRLYRVPDISSQLGFIGWDLLLNGQPAGTEIALRRNAVPGRWNSRSGTSVTISGNTDYSSTAGFLQRQDHPADIWYIGVYNPNEALGSFVLDRRTYAATNVEIAIGGNVVTNQPANQFRYFRLDVPAGIRGVDVRLTNVLSGDPRLVIRRDRLPDGLNSHTASSSQGWSASTDNNWPTTYQWAPGDDWTGYSQNPSGGNESGRLVAAALGNPFEPGTYYIGVVGPSGATTPLSYTLSTRFIGDTQAITIAPLTINSVVSVTNVPREPSYFSISVPSNTASLRIKVTNIVGESALLMQKELVPNIGASANASPFSVNGGTKISKSGDETYFILPPSGASNLPPGNYIAALVGLGMNASGNRIGTNVSAATLLTLGEVPIADLGTFGGADLVQSDTVASAEFNVYRFTLPAGMLGAELRLENKVGNPKMALRAGLGIPAPTDSYGSYGGQNASWSSTDLIYLPNPNAGVYTLTIQAGTVSSAYVPASFTIRLKGVTSAPLAFDDGSVSVAGQPIDTWRYFAITVPTNALGWDLRLVNVTSGDPRVVIRRGLAPTSLSTLTASSSGWSAGSSTTWPVGYQWALGTDYTGYNQDANGTNRNGHILTCGMGNPLEPGDYIVGVYTGNGTGSGNPMSYTLQSRGIGAGYAIGIADLDFAGGTTNFTDVAARDFSFLRITVPSNTPSWRLTLSTNLGDSFFVLQRGALPNVTAGDTANPANINGGRRVKKIGHETFTLLPPSSGTNIAAGTYYLAFVSEGVGATSTRAGSNSASATLTSLGPITNVNLGALSSGANIVRPDTLTGGEVRAYQFTVDASVLSMQLRLTNRVGTPKMVLRRGTLTPAPTDSYGNEGGSSATWSDASFIDIANPVSDTYTLLVQAGGSSGLFPDASFTILIEASGTTPIAFDGGSVNVTNQPSGTWRYFYVTVPSNTAGWDLRITNVLSGDPRLVVRREQLPASLQTLTSSSAGWAVASATSWPTGYQWAAGGDWTGYANAANGTNETGHILTCGMGNPLSPGNYMIGVFSGNGTGSGNPMSYTLVSRGIGDGFTIPIGTLGFEDSVSGGPLAPREVDYYRITVPSNSPNWKLRVTPSAGEVVLLVNKGALPSVGAADGTTATSMSGGRRMQRTGAESYLLLPVNAPYVAAGDYYIGVVSEGLNPTSTRTGTNNVSYTLTSLGSIAPQSLGVLDAGGIVVNGAPEGGDPTFYTFSVPPTPAGIELRLENAVGGPRMRLRANPSWPDSYYTYTYGFEGGDGTTWDSASLISIPNAAATNYTLLMQGNPNVSNVSFTLRLQQVPLTEMNFSPGLNANGLTNVATGNLLDNQRAFYRFVVPPMPWPVLGWKLALNASAGAATLRVKKDSLPLDSDGNVMSFVSSAIIAPPYLTTGVYYVEVKGAGGTSYTLTSDEVQLQRGPWQMPLAGQAPNTPGLSAPDFGDSGVQTNGVALPGDQGVDVDQGGFHFYAIDVPELNGGIIRVLLEAINGNPDFYLRRGAIPTLTHEAAGKNGSLYDRALDATGTEYANFVALDGRYETALPAGKWYVAIRGSGNSNARYRLKLSTGNVTDLPLHGTNLTSQTVAARDFRYYRVVVPSNAPAAWNVTFTEQIGNVIMYVRDTTPPGQGTSTTDFKDWSSDSKNNGPYASYDTPGAYSLPVPPLRPGHVYYLGFRGVTDGTFTLTTSTNGGTIPLAGTLEFYGGSVSNVLPAFSTATYRIDVPADARRLRITNFANANVKLFLEQGTLPKLSVNADDWNGSGAVLMNQALSIGSGWPWVPAQSYYLTITNASATSQTYVTQIDGRNCATDDNDTDGMPDCWEQLYFGGTNPSATQDSDNDGNNNLLEYLDGTNPALASSMLARLTVNTNGAGTIEISQTGPYPYGEIVFAYAAPLPGMVFLGWSGTFTSTDPLIVLSMVTNYNLTANFGYDYGEPGLVRADYRFQSNFVSSVGQAPDLTPINSNWAFVRTNVGGTFRTVQRWNTGSSVQLPGASTVFPTNTYTIAMLFRLDLVTAWRRLLDFKNPASDSGLYVHEGRVNIYSGSEANVTCMTNGTWHQVVMTREPNNTVRVYVDGVLRLTHLDSTGICVLNSGDRLRFFKDDAGEEIGGHVARIRIWASALPESEVAALDRFADGGQPADPFALSAPRVDAQNQFTFDVTGPGGFAIVVESTTNWTTWSTVTNVGSFEGSLKVITSPNVPARFFRVRTP